MRGAPARLRLSAVYSGALVDTTHWGQALRALARHLRDPGFARRVLTAGLEEDRAPRARPAVVHVAYPEVSDCVVRMGDVGFRLFNLDPTERFVLAALAQLRRPRRIFEFGTYDGATTLLLARAAPEAEVLTLDLPAGSADWFEEEQLAAAGGTGAAFRSQPEAPAITQILADSRTFDAGPYEGSIDFVLVDGSHDYECVRADTENAFRMLAPGGVIVWDDYSRDWPDVVRAVDELAEREGLEILSLALTGLAVWDSLRSPRPVRGA